ncbi:MAG TPA: hypothetical protein PKC24_09090, partial [Cyclobacteriaceae bacterium]|nr:hypothetical protein [Cyclobacteriaceae bacterium]
MNQNFFWNTWPQAYKRVFYFLSLLTMLALMLSWFWYFKGNDNVISWLTGQSVKTFSMPVYAFQLGPFQIETDSDFYVIIERIFASDLIPQTLPLYFFLVVLGIALIVLLSIISTLSRYWYLLGMAVFILFVVSLGLPQLRLLGRIDNLPVAAMLLVFLLPSYYLHSFKKDASFNARLLVFTLLTGVVAFFIHLFAGVQSPLLQLAAYAQTVPLIISILFIFIVSHEIPASFISVLSNNAFKGKAAHQFLFIAALYLLNLVVTYLQYIYIIDWNFIFINLLLLFSISALLGLWGFKNREPQYENILPFKPLGALLFLALALISFGFLAQAYGNANDPYIKVIRDAILYSHLGYGIIFVTYVASNFLSMLSNNLPVNKVLYKPNRMPYFTFNLAGLIATLAFVFVNNWKVPYFNSYAGYYNSIADVHNILGEDEAAEGYYRMANTQSFGVDHHSNFVIAGIERNKYERIKERVHLERANQLRPSEYAYVDLGNNLYKSGMADDAIRLYLKAYQLYPDVGAISNNLALSFYERQAYDSAF